MSLGGVLIISGKGQVSKPLTGLRGLTIAVEGNLSVKVRDYKGRALASISIKTDQGKEYFTDNEGNAFITFTTGSLTLSKYRYKRTYSVPDGVAQVSFQFAKPLPR